MDGQPFYQGEKCLDGKDLEKPPHSYRNVTFHKCDI